MVLQSGQTGNTIKTNSVIKYSLTVNPIGKGEHKNVNISVVIPEGLTYQDNHINIQEEAGQPITKATGTYNESTRTVTWHLDELGSYQCIYLECMTNDFEGDSKEKPIDMIFEGTMDGTQEKFHSNTYTVNVVKEGLTITQTSNVSNPYIRSGENITYTFNIKNTSLTALDIFVEDNLPRGLEYVEGYYTKGGERTKMLQAASGYISADPSIDPDEVITFNITAKAKEIHSSRLEITNTPQVSTGIIKELKANSITHTIIGTDANIDDLDDPNDTSRYQISGLAWLDSNADGKRDESEELLPNMNVILLDSKTNAQISKTTTNQGGAYVFNNIQRGSYLVAFEYDVLNYDITKYQAKDIDSSLNSDMIELDLKLDGTLKRYAVSNRLNLISNIYNIDLGLVKSQKFDLELTKGISLMQVSNSKGTSTSKYNNSSIAKVEIPGKQMEGSVVAITYTITVKNTGAVPGYAKKIVDYIPRDLKFNAGLNPDWYQDTDGNLYTQSLANVLINPGEEKTISLVLTKTMTSENTGITTNTAELYEVSNDLGLDDMDSKVANRSTTEDDYGLADAIVAVKTGGIVLYGGITFTVIAIFAIGAFIIKKKVLKYQTY